MKSTGLMFKAPLVRAILSGQKTQTRRLVKGKALEWLNSGFTPEYVALPENGICPFGYAGDQIYVRESFYIASARRHEYGIGFNADHKTGRRLSEGDGGYNFRAFSADPEEAGEQWNWACRHTGTDKWIPSIHMPRWASRITRDITELRVERLQDISEEDALAEGFDSREDFAMFFAPEVWNANRWVWAISLKQVKS